MLIAIRWRRQKNSGNSGTASIITISASLSPDGVDDIKLTLAKLPGTKFEGHRAAGALSQMHPDSSAIGMRSRRSNTKLIRFYWRLASAIVHDIPQQGAYGARFRSAVSRARRAERTSN